eukprot:TRINITY_DN10026_c0_g2_i1.p1 TRINITY_DN10026_c0_g2~~TRINITY_DN10026_c0_g2_i1.p1  ORF type:complete len:841 (-),score=145.62 TRINITY_DN10026_c0_g2_i1:277-2799(-)
MPFASCGFCFCVPTHVQNDTLRSATMNRFFSEPVKRHRKTKLSVNHDVVVGGQLAAESEPESDDSEDSEQESKPKVLAKAPVRQSAASSVNKAFTPEDMERIVECMNKKGFCLVGFGDEAGRQERLLEARDEATDMLNATGLFKPTPSLLAEGFLGDEGSAEIHEMGGDNDTDIDEKMQPGIAYVNTLLSEASYALASYAPYMDIGIQGRSGLILHHAGIPLDGESHPELTEMDCHKWHSLFSSSRVMLAMFLGPSLGKLELFPFAAEAGVHPLEVNVGPGTLALIRADALSHKFSASSRSMAATCFLMEGSGRLPPVWTPTTEGLMEWASERMAQIKASKEKGERVDLRHLPKSWIKQLPTTTERVDPGPQVAVRGMSCKFPTTYSAAGWWCASQAGGDIAEQVPITRWDHSTRYDDDPESWKWGKICVKHMAYIDGIDQFDNKFFGISALEARSMDAGQRHVLETGYEALYYAGHTKKSLMRSLIGCYIGAATTEMVLAEVSLDAGSAGTGGASSITSNRISYCLGMQGPSFTVDSEGAAALSALTSASMSLRFQTELYRPNHAALVGGVYLNLASPPWIILCSKNLLSTQGRCFTFDVSAEGYVKSEGVSNIYIDLLDETVDGKKVTNNSPVHGIISSTSMNHTGRGASLTAACGPQERECVDMALRQANLESSSIDMVECWSSGQLLQDASEAAVLNGTLRGDSVDQAPLLLSAGNTGCGYQHECNGMGQLLKVLMAHKTGVSCPLVHLHQINVHIDLDDTSSVQFATEQVGFGGLYSYCGITGKSIAGSMVHTITHGYLQQISDAQTPEADTEQSRVAALKLAASEFWNEATDGY